jgi:hypothetical protein
MTASDPAAVTAALVRFRERLERAEATGRGRHGRLPAGATSARFAAQAFVKATQLFMQDVGLGGFTALPLTLLEALGDLDRGNAVPPLDPAPIWSRPPPPLAVARNMTRAAKALDLLRQTTGLAEAVKQVWRTRPSWDGLFDSPDSLIEFRQNLRRGRAPADAQRLWTMPLPEVAGASPAEQAAYLLTMLGEG